jgi:hypothetical protein
VDGNSYPAGLGFDGPPEVQNWRPLLNWLLAIPHLLILYALRVLRQVLLIISFFAVLFTKAIPVPLFDVIVMTLRYRWRTKTYVVWMRNSYPPFSFNMAAADDGIDPAWLTVERPAQVNRWLPLVKWLLAIPHYIVLIFLTIGTFFAGLAAFFVVLFTGRYPPGLRAFQINVHAWKLRVASYALFLRDEYPPFSLNVGGPGAVPAAGGGEMPASPSMPPVPPPVPPAPPDTGP